MSDSNNDQSLIQNKRFLVVGAVVACALAWTFLNNSTKKVEQVDVAAKPIEVGSDAVNQITVKDKDASLTVFGKQFEVVDQRFIIFERDAAERDANLRKEMKESTNNLKSQVASLTNDITTLRAKGVEAAYQNANRSDTKTIQTPPSLPANLPDLSLEKGLNFDNLNFNMDAPQPQQQAQQVQQGSNPYGPNYFILKPTSANGTTTSRKSGGDSLNASEAELFSSMSTPAAQNTNFNDKTAGQGQVQGQAQPQHPQRQYANAAEAYADQQQNNQNQTGQAPTGPKMERITIPAFSKVNVTTLHGVACPIGANSPGTKSEIPAKPVVLPVRGIFQGPNGSSVDVGSIHLMGLCSGRRTVSSDAGRATIRVEQMSYWDEGGGAQMSGSTGYIVDSRDNEADVYGRLDKASGRTLALESMAAAGSAFASALSQAEYTTQSSLGATGAASVQQLTGSATQAASTQGIAAIFNKIASRFEQEANAAIDTVVVEPGIRLQFITDQPINIYKPAEAFDLDGGKSDVLL
ncbi:conjugal transfer protein TraB [Pseudomonas syringae]|uniref:conjugal transfer protein TraB n=1 Tax=Pseudomonas syringae TaxID=317 RepID=UPI001F31EA2B|nr:conjugal transfer protein TraB [Pseudomonas syringae]MCF5381940.1 conjugal transfer protein TraB [Pseudomonas syringae]MCF5423806.1 conjugal transfer protein TraB [Pseudomonas syringae]MCF5454997.1 conjugal transfer protein TraB [Pseudomonas syringae]MCF5459565.1 conjugal transfer protein TraB [Pseudomonas syringae]